MNIPVQLPANSKLDPAFHKALQERLNALGRRVVVSNELDFANAVPITTSISKTLIDITLGPGTWAVSGVAEYLAASTTVLTDVGISINDVTNTFAGGSTNTFRRTLIRGLSFTGDGSGGFSLATPSVLYTLSKNTTLYLVVFTKFTTSTLTAWGKIIARAV